MGCIKTIQGESTQTPCTSSYIHRNEWDGLLPPSLLIEKRSNSFSTYGVHWLPMVIRCHIRFISKSFVPIIIVTFAVHVRLRQTTIYTFSHGEHSVVNSAAHLPFMVFPICLLMVIDPVWHSAWWKCMPIKPLFVRGRSRMCPTFTFFHPFSFRLSCIGIPLIRSM